MAIGYVLSGRSGGAVIFVLLGGGWWMGERWRAVPPSVRRWLRAAGLVSFVGGAVNGLWLEVGAGWMLLGVLGALAAWDVMHVAARLRAVDQVIHREALERAHLRQLLLAEGFGGLFGAAGLLMRLDLRFGIALLLGLLGFVGISRLIRLGAFRN